MNTVSPPRFLDLEDQRIREVLGRNNVGRVAFSRANRIEIIPVHYVYLDDWVYGRTAAGGRLDQAGERWWPVAFEVDEIDGLFDWRSVVMRGGLYILSPEGAAWEREAWETGVELIRGLIPGALSEDDPVPFRSRLFRIAVQQASGRESTTRAE